MADLDTNINSAEVMMSGAWYNYRTRDGTDTKLVYVGYSGGGTHKKRIFVRHMEMSEEEFLAKEAEDADSNPAEKTGIFRRIFLIPEEGCLEGNEESFVFHSVILTADKKVDRLETPEEFNSEVVRAIRKEMGIPEKGFIKKGEFEGATFLQRAKTRLQEKQRTVLTPSTEGRDSLVVPRRVTFGQGGEQAGNDQNGARNETDDPDPLKRASQIFNILPPAEENNSGDGTKNPFLNENPLHNPSSDEIPEYEQAMLRKSIWGDQLEEEEEILFNNFE